MNNTYTVGTGKVDVTPPLSVPFLGLYPNRLSYFKGVHDKLLARSLYVGTGSGEALIVSVDLIGISDAILGHGRSFVTQLKQMITEKTGIPAAHILLAATHAHSTPETINFRPVAELVPEFKPWLETLMERIAAAALSACQNRFPAKLRIMRAQVPGLTINRTGAEWLDDELILLEFASQDGRKALLVNFTCHPVIMQVQPMVSADYPGALTSTLEETIPGAELCLFMQGACGDINPLKGDTRDFNDVQMTGATLAENAISLLKQAPPADNDIPPQVRVVSTNVPFKSAILPTPDKTAQLEHEAAALERQVAEGNRATGITDKLAVLHEALARIRQGEDDRSAVLQTVRIGNAVLFAMPFEPCCQLGRKLKQMAAPLTGIPVGYANGYLGYVNAPDVAGAYEASCGPWNQVDQQAFELIIKHFSTMPTACG